MNRELIPGYAAPLFALDQVVLADEHRIVTIKQVSAEPFFAGHFPGHPIFPGVFILETVHQAVRYYSTLRHRHGAKLIEIRSMRFVSPVQPGDSLECNCECALVEGAGQLRVAATCRCGSRKVAEMKLLYSLEDANAAKSRAD